MLLNLDNLKLLSRNSDTFVCEILKVYIENTPKDLEKMADALSQENWGMVQYYAHKLKSSAFTIGFYRGHSTFQQIEQKLRNKETDNAIQGLFDEALKLSSDSMLEAREQLFKHS